MTQPTKWLRVRAKFEGTEPETVQDLAGAVFFSLDMPGVAFGPDQDGDPAWRKMQGLAPAAQVNDQPQAFWVDSFLPEGADEKDALTSLEKGLLSLELPDGTRFLGLETALCSSDSWEGAWKKYFHVTRITDRLVVCPSWETYAPAPHESVIHIDPQMAFGTGAHETTSMCMALLEQALAPGMSFLDVGTGSGILMIAAHLLGAAQVAGTDNDHVALLVAAQNLGKNQVPQEKTTLVLSDLCDGIQVRGFDLVCANIEAGPVSELLDRLRGRLAPGAHLLLSGILNTQAEEIEQKLHEISMQVKIKDSKGEWTAFWAVAKARGSL